MQQIILGLGSNRPFNNMSSLQILEKACLELKELTSNPIFSSVYVTKAMYVEDQNDFHNMVCIAYVNDDEDPFEFLKKINQIEAKYGRDREKEIRFGPRSLDIDIEAFGNQIINTEVLQIPHPRIEERAFVLIPLLEIFSESADKQKREHYIQCLNKLQQNGDATGVEKFCTLLVDQNGTEKRE